jgi:asparagine synthase (glutamine-hydrolysing)
VRRQGEDWRAIHHRHRDTFDEATRVRLLGGDAGAGADDFPDAPGADPVLRCQARDLGTYLLDDILTKVDRMSMDNSLEVRVPLLDHKLVEFAFTLPPELRMRPTANTPIGKYLLKRAAERYFPRTFLDRPKWGFGIPIHTWLGDRLRPMVMQLLDSEAPHLASLVDPAPVRRIVRNYYAGRRELAGPVWNLLSLRLWLDGAASAASSAKAA